MSNKNFSGKLGIKGYYIALILCAVAIGISGYLFYRNSQEPEQLQNQPTQSLEVPEENIEAVATQPSTQGQQEHTPVPVTPGKSKITAPVSGNLALDYAMDALCYNPTTRDWRTHNGMDIAAAEGTEVCAAADGMVESVTDDDTMGMTVVISHTGGYTTTYASLDKEVAVVAGQAVEAGQKIGVVGNTALLETALGEHLHFAASCNGKVMDPEEFLKLGSL